jgi:hypothetical protein
MRFMLSSRTALPAADAVTSPSRLCSLTIEHDDLDAAIGALLKSGLCDDLLITPLKKRKLQIKDEMTCILTADQPEPVARAS